MTTIPQNLKCTKCNELKHLSNFYKRRQGKFGVMRACKDCLKNPVDENLKGKICNLCKDFKQKDEFYISSYNKDGLSVSCKNCVIERKNKRDFKPDKSITEKKCKGCKLILPISKFAIGKRNKDGYQFKCRSCIKGLALNNEPDYSIEEKECINCKIIKNINLFNKQRKSSTGWSNVCKECNNNRSKLEKIKNPEGFKLRARNAELRRKDIPKSQASLRITQLKSKCKRKGIKFDLDKEWLLEKYEKGKCEKTGIKFVTSVLDEQIIHGSSKRYINIYTPAIDRINPKEGYVKKNCRLVITLFNTFKGPWKDEDVKIWAKGYLGKKVNLQFKQPDEHEVLVKRAKAILIRNKSKKLPFNIDENWIVNEMKKGKCSVSGIPFDWRKQSVYVKYPFSPSLDKIIPEKGYVKGNVRMTCLIFNTGRQNTPDKFIKEFAEIIIKK
tara:strand:+ start:38 stop:1360 length:1323 start_codon:yes stop_codon:yes gene_type:complete